MRRLLFLLACVLAAFPAAPGGCGPRALPPLPAEFNCQPGRYVQESYFAANFTPEELTYTINPFTWGPGNDGAAESFLKIFQDELVSSWQAQGLQLGQGEQAGRLSGTIQHLSLQGARLRWLTGRLHAALVISGTITRGDQVLFAFRDQVNLSSPVAPGLAAPKEEDLLLRQLARETVHHLLNELLLSGTQPSPD